MSQHIVRRAIPDTFPNLGPEVPAVLARVYALRNITEAAQLERGLEFLPAVDQMLGLDAAVAILVTAMMQRQRVLIIGDFDADGATSSTVAVRALRMMGIANVDFLVPNRFEFGYGLTPEIVEVAKQFSPDVIVTVDNGIASIDGVDAAKANGWQVVVTDHHLPGDTLPAADAVVNPNQPGCLFPSKNLAGVGVIFYVMLGLRAALRDQGWFEQQGITIPNLGSLLDLVALGTVADVVILDHVNRILVAQGLARIRRGVCCPGISALLELGARKQDQISAADMGFIVGPRLNAAGRLEDMSIGINCLLSEQMTEALIAARELDRLNRERRSIEQEMQAQAMLNLEQIQWDDEQAMPTGLCIYQEDWHQGVIGILASRIKDKFHRPVIAFAAANDDEIKGSARSVPGFHIRDGLDAVATANPGLITKFGGHAMAAGLSIKRDRLAEFQTAFDVEVCRHLSLEDLRGVVWSDGELPSNALSIEVAEQLKAGGPWGQGFPEPTFDGEFTVLNKRIVGERHLKLVLQTLDGSQSIDAIAFNTSDEAWPETTTQVRVAFKLDINEYKGRRSPQLMVDFIEPL